MDARDRDPIDGGEGPTGPADERETARGSGWVHAVRRRLRAAREIYEGVFYAPYRSAVRREYRRQHDLFMLLAFSDLAGAPNPLVFYTLELYPHVIERYHEWHLRLGMDEPPAGGFRCC